MVQLSMQMPTLDLTGAIALLLHPWLIFCQTSPVQQQRKLYCTGKQTNLQCHCQGSAAYIYTGKIVQYLLYRLSDQLTKLCARPEQTINYFGDKTKTKNIRIMATSRKFDLSPKNLVEYLWFYFITNSIKNSRKKWAALSTFNKQLHDRCRICFGTCHHIQQPVEMSFNKLVVLVKSYYALKLVLLKTGFCSTQNAGNIGSIYHSSVS